MKNAKYLLLILVLFYKISFGQDTMPLAIIDGKAFVIHKVMPRQNLYRISRYYQLTTQEIKDANNFTADTLRKGSEILIPLTSKNFTLRPNLKKPSVNYNALILDADEVRSLKSLCSALNVEKEDLQAFFKKKKTVFNAHQKNYAGYLITYQIELTPKPVAKPKVDSLHFVSGVITPIKLDTSKPKTETKILPDSIKKPVEIDTVKKVITNPQQTLFAKLYNRTEMPDEVEKGTALGMQTDSLGNYQKGFYAFHNEFKTGTIVKVKNPMNENEVYVKILGKIPERPENLRCTIKISHDAAMILDARDERFLVEIFHH